MYRKTIEHPEYLPEEVSKHTDFESGKAQLPAGMPFEPDWVMQVVGMTKLPPGKSSAAP